MNEQTTDRLPPYSLEAEQGVLGCLLLAPDGINELLARHRKPAEMFYDVRHQSLIRVMMELHAKQQPIDAITIQQILRDRNIFEGVGGLAYLSSLQDRVPSGANLLYYADIVREKMLVRRLVGICSEAVPAAYNWQGHVEDLLLKVESEISQLTEAETIPQEEHIKPIVQRVLEDIEKHYSRGSTQMRGLPTMKAANYMDKLLQGIKPTDYVVIAGRPGEGKSAFALNIVEYNAIDYEWFEPVQAADGTETVVAHKGVPVAVFSIEMSSESLVHRMLFGRAGVDTATFAEGYAKGGSFAKLISAAGQLVSANIYIDATPGQGIEMIAAKARRMVKQYGIKLFVLDYLQLVEMEGGSGFDRVKELTKISRKIMALKKQLGVPWLVLAQMNRNIESQESRGRAPLLSDLKDCGAIEQDADVVMLLYKTPDRLLAKEPKHGGMCAGELLDYHNEGLSWGEHVFRVDSVVAKNRNGPTGNVQLAFQKNLCRFEDWHLWKAERGYEKLKKGERKAVVKTPPEQPKQPEMNEEI